MKYVLSFLFMSAVAVSAPVEEISFDMMHTVQECKHPGHQKTWCDGATSDTADMAKLSGMEDAINAQLDRALANPEKARVYAAEFSFSDKAIQDKMCQLGKAGVQVRIYLDRGSAANLDFVKGDCQKDPANPNLIGVLLGGYTNIQVLWRLHHNKTVVVDPGDGSFYNIDFSSGNLSRFGMSLHQDHWVMLQAPADSNLVRASLCLFQGLEVADQKTQEVGSDPAQDPQVMSAYQSKINSCYQEKNVIPMDQYEKAVAQEGIAPFFTPNSGQLAVKALKAQIQSVIQQQKSGQQTYIWIAIEHFSKADIAALLRQAADSGTDVRVLMNSGTVTGATEVASDGPFYKANLKNTKIQVRFIETNPNAGGNGQQMHNKFAIFNGKRVFSGAGHYTGSGLNNNFETLYLTQNPTLTQKYEVYFKELWDVSVDEAYFNNQQ